MTMVLDVKPEGGGYLLFWGWNFLYSITGGPKQFGLCYQLSSGKPVESKPFLDAGQWQKLVVVAADNQLKLYRDGKLVQTLPAKLQAGSWGLHHTSTWHRHLSFFGSGPGDMTLVKDNPTGGMKGKCASLVIYKRALTDQEIATMAGGVKSGS
jgi:hypothetical protein